MNEPTFTVTPSFLRRLIRQSCVLNNEGEVINAYIKLSLHKHRKLRERDADLVFGDDADERELIFDNIPKKLKGLADELYALVMLPESEDAESEDAESEDDFPLSIRDIPEQVSADD